MAKGFKSSDLELLIPQGLQAEFLELQKRKGIVASDEWGLVRGEWRVTNGEIEEGAGIGGSGFGGDGGQGAAEGVFPGGEAAGLLDFELDGMAVVEEELGDIGEGGGLAAGEAVLGEEVKEFTEDVGEVAGGGEFAGKGGEFGGDGGGVEELALLAGVEGAEGGVGFVAQHGALAAVGSGEEAAAGLAGGGVFLGKAVCFHGDGQEEGSSEAVR